MKLSKYTICNKFDIKKPIWNGRKVGLATHKIGFHNEVNILSENKDGQRLYPNSFYISGDKAVEYPSEPVKSNPSISLYIIPIADMEILERE